jgi:transmembrane sensor
MRAWNTPISGARWMVAAAATICAIAVLAIWWWVGSAYVTAHGEQRLVYLDDGSRVYLNSDSRLRVEFKASERRIRLQHGEGFFEVAKDATRPFIVEVGAQEVEALGTTFIVRHELDRTAITLVEGKVTVSPMAVAKAFTLVPGERLTLARLTPPALDAPRLEAVTAWRRGEVLLDATALEEAISEMNRYDKRQLFIDDAELAVVRVSGIYRTGDSLGFAQAVAELHGFDVHDGADEIHLRRRPASQ